MKIKKDLIEKIFARGEFDAPVEICGYLAGIGDTVAEDYPVTNIERSAEHFTMEPKEQFDAMRRARADGLKILAVYHTHPATPARPSDEDIRLAFDPAIVYVIASLAGGARSIKAFRILSGKVVNEDLSVV
jgi:proteasome lid subunit RPN8/RPN11